MVIAIGRPKKLSDAEVADWVVGGGVPAVSVLADWRDRRIPCFHTDHEALARLAAAHLVACGCKSFLFFGYSASTGSAAWGRAFCETLAGQGRRAVEYAASQVYLGSVEDENKVRREKGLARLLLDLPKPLGVWALNDNFASAVCIACGRAGLAVPASVKVLGTDDLAIARTHDPPLSSIRSPGETIGYLAMKKLHGMLLGKRPTRLDTVVAPEDVVAPGIDGRRLRCRGHAGGRGRVHRPARLLRNDHQGVAQGYADVGRQLQRPVSAALRPDTLSGSAARADGKG